MSAPISYAIIDTNGNDPVILAGGAPVVLHGYCILTNPGNGFQIYDGLAKYTEGVEIALFYRDGGSKFVALNPGMVLTNGLWLETGDVASIALFYQKV